MMKTTAAANQSHSDSLAVRNIMSTSSLYCIVIFAFSFLLLVPALPVEEASAEPPPPPPPPSPPHRAALDGVVNSLLSSLLRQTLYNRMEQMLLDPRGPVPSRSELEQERILEAAVENYRHQNIRQQHQNPRYRPEDFKKLAGIF